MPESCCMNCRGNSAKTIRVYTMKKYGKTSQVILRVAAAALMLGAASQSYGAETRSEVLIENDVNSNVGLQCTYHQTMSVSAGRYEAPMEFGVVDCNSSSVGNLYVELAGHGLRFRGTDADSVGFNLYDVNDVTGKALAESGVSRSPLGRITAGGHEAYKTKYDSHQNLVARHDAMTMSVILEVL